MHIVKTYGTYIQIPVVFEFRYRYTFPLLKHMVHSQMKTQFDLL